MSTNNNDDNMKNAIRNGRGHVESIVELAKRLQSDDDDTREAAQDEVYQYPLSVEVRGGWHTIGGLPEAVEEFKILISTGGPACQIVGDLNENMEPSDVRLEVQDWFTPWTPVELNDEAEAALLTFCQAFYFGE